MLKQMNLVVGILCFHLFLSYITGQDNFYVTSKLEPIREQTDNFKNKNKSCIIPPPSVNNTVTYLCPENATKICNPENGSVPEHTIALIKCSPGYEKEEKDHEKENNEYICHNKKWLPKIDRCYKICDKLNPVNVDLQCFRNGTKIRCDENTVLLHGTTVRASCKQTHNYSSGSPPGYSEITCDSEGKWTNTLFSCVRECGKMYTNPNARLIKRRTLEHFSDFPWHVAIYTKKKVLICGGTIITPKLVVSAAHCFHEKGSFTRGGNASDYEVVVGKVTKRYDINDNSVQTTYKIKNILSEKGYFGAVNFHEADIAIVVLEEKIEISSEVLPACIDWVALRGGIYPAEDTPGKVIGWGINEHGNYSNTLATVDLPFLSHKRCLENVPNDFKKFITFDKFCAGTKNDSGLLRGDSGAGLVFKKNNHYYLHGVVSIKQLTSTGIAAFTDIADHVKWISKVSEEIEEEMNQNTTELQTTTPTPNTTEATTRDNKVKYPQNSGTNRPPATSTSPSSTTKTLPSKHSVSIVPEIISNQEIPKEQTNDCKSSEFQCKNNLCIAKSFVCDGLRDCLDASDETHNQCQNITCDEEYFQCHYGACINKTYQCDGIKQCIDGSDELAELCDGTSHQSSRKSRATVNSKSCSIPAQSADKRAYFFCSNDTSSVCNPKNGLVAEYTTALIKCSPGYAKERKDDEEENNEYHVCLNKKWLPKIDGCYKICDKLNPVNVDLRCFRNGLNIRCDENTELLHDTRVRPSCKQIHKYSSGSPPDYSEITCNREGKWDNTLFSCTPECGIPYTNPKLLIKGGTKEKFGDSPWHVAIYNNKNILICGGTIITPNLVVSAAHCFQEGESSPKSGNANDYEVVVGKVTRKYYANDSVFQKTHKIKKIRYSSKGYFGVVNGYQADIVILVLEERLNISSAVLPACIDWVALRDGIYPADNTLGKVVGWGNDETGTESDTLVTTDLPFLSHERCLQTVPDDFKQFITFDKFCAGSENGSGVLQGDSGGGLLFKKNNTYFLQGIVSIKQPTSTGIAAFTDIAEHEAWITKVRKEVEEELNKNPTKYQTTTTTITTTKATIIDDRVKFPQNLGGTNRPPITPASPSSNAKTSSSKNAVSIALENCKKYAEYRIERKWYPAMANRPGYWENKTDCVNVAPLIVQGIRAKLKEYPHMALIGFGDDFKKVEWGYAGSLISEKFILSVTTFHGSSIGPARWVLLGDLELDSVYDDAKPAVYEIKKIYQYPSDKLDRIMHDIALYELNTTAELSPYVRPACLHTSTSIPVNTKASIAGWGRTDTIGRMSNNLLKATISVFDHKLCNETYSNTRNRYDPDTMICAGDFVDGKDTCSGDSGAPLQTPLNEQACMWDILGITSFGPSFCGNGEEPSVYTNVAYYLSWIQTIVWPQ